MSGAANTSVGPVDELQSLTSGSSLADTSSMTAFNNTSNLTGNMSGAIPIDEPPGNMPGSTDIQIPTLSSNVVSPETPQEFGVFFGPIQQHTGVYHNNNGVFLPWSSLCKMQQAYLLQPCSNLIGPEGSLTSTGQTAVGCITNGAIITVLAAKFNLQVGPIKGILSALATPTGCDGIVNLDAIPNSPDIQRLLDIAATAAP